MTPEILNPGQTSLAQLERLFRSEAPAVLDPSARKGVDWAAAQIAKAAAGSAAVYGVNTGFGKLASLKIAPQDTETFLFSGPLPTLCLIQDLKHQCHSLKLR